MDSNDVELEEIEIDVDDVYENYNLKSGDDSLETLLLDENSKENKEYREKFRKELSDKIMTKEEMKKYKLRQRTFYKHQNKVIQNLLDLEKEVNDDDEIDDEKESAAKKDEIRTKIGIYGSAAINVLLFFIKCYAAFASGSLSVIASALDSFLDLLSGLIIFITERITKKAKPENYPAGKSRFEPLGIIVFSAAMFTATFQVIVRSTETLLSQDFDISVDYLTLGILFTTVALKFILWLYCRTVRHSHSCQALAADHRNDVISNLFGISTALLGYYIYPPIDAFGAIIISLYIMFVWFRTGAEQLSALTGKVAKPELLNSFTFLARQHHCDAQVDTVRAYHYGYNYFIEVDIILPPETSLREAHDIGESLQNKFEKLDIIERAFVHLDYEGEHKPEHNN
eukprot:TRINITY_DN14999_c0_g1_i1.p1 TRINITY_DN14999_c0_g1~~TRINITY_DN14999_c0_g1_i1.p1  ORF type:complete len:399 (-),score=110.97 TRINITY_DN14999_c0_g1_i1:103-1299(-)